MGYFKTVIIPVFNGEKYLDRALHSILIQTLKIDEVIIINDASTDMTKDIIKKWFRYLPIKYYENKLNMGVPYSLRKAIKNTKAEFIFRLDCDDAWKNDHVENLNKLFNKDSESVLYASKTEYFSKNRGIFYTSKTLSNNDIRSLLMWDNPIVHSSVAFRKKDYLKTKGYRKDFKYTHDYALFIDLMRIGKLSFSDKVSVEYYVYENSLSHKEPKKCLLERFNNQWKALFLFGFTDIFHSLKVFPILFLRSLIRK